MTYAQTQMDLPAPTSSAEDSPAKTSPWLEHVRDWLANGARFGLNTYGWSEKHGQLGSLSKTSLVFYLRSKVRTWRSSSQVLPNAGTVWHGACWTANFSESPNADAVCTLSAILEAHAPSKYSLSQRAATGLLRRAERRGKTLPTPLAAALLCVAGLTTPDRAGAFIPIANTLHVRENKNDTPDIDTYIVNARQNPITGKQPLDTRGASLAVAHRLVAPTLNASGAGTSRPGGPRLASEEQYLVVGAETDADGVREATGVPGRMDTPDGPRYAALGDAVSVPVAEWIAGRIRAVAEA